MKFVKWRSVRPARFFVQSSAFASDGDPLKTEFHSVAPFFFLSEALDIFTTYWLCRYASSTKTNLNFHLELFWPVWYCDENEWDLGGVRSKLSHSFTLTSPLGNKRLNFLSVQLPPAWMKGSDKTDQDFKVGISNEDRRMNTDSEQSRNSPAGTGKARLFFFNIFFIVNIRTTETNFIAIKYCYLQYLCCLLCNPTTQVNQIKGSDTLKYCAQCRLIFTRSINTSISLVRTSATQK